MIFQAVKVDRDEMELFKFAWLSDSLRLRFLKYQKFNRSHELGEWNEIGLWQYPDIQEESNLQQPEVPQWAKLNALTELTSKIEFDL